jgi:formylglycine-generating enzyme required for sulfatase activity
MEFCAWLSEKAGVKAALPAEAQWEYACRAGTATPLSYGGLDSDFSRCANMADATLRGLAQEGWRPLAPDLVPRVDRWSDAALVTADVGSYAPNAWGLHDMHGNAAEWTRSSYSPYPCRADAPALQGSPPAPDRKVVRGGSWRDRPLRCRSAFRLGYLPSQKVFNVGFRVVFEEPPEFVGGARASRTP